jgi:hypothetical protein
MRFLIVLLVLLPAPGLALAQAGRFLLAVGDVVVARGQAEIRAATGTEVQSGDTIRVGPASNAQIRLTDESIVALRPGTLFRLDEFAYSGQGDGNERSLFTLLKGGFRTVTGAIGRLHSRERYAVRTPTATIGIRGTHYTVVHCDDDCGTLNRVSLAALDNIAQSDAAPGVGQSIPNGTYGGVTDGRIEVVNQTGEHEFAANTFFYVATASTAPQSLIAPPTFLYDRLEGQSRSRGNQSNESSETMARSGLNAESRPSEVPPPPQPSTFIVTEQKTSSGQPAVIAGTPTPTLGFAGAWTSAIGSTSSVTAFVSEEMLTRTGRGTSQTLTAFNILGTASGAATKLGPINESGGGFDPGDGSVNANWGVWTSGSITDGLGTTSMPGGAHYIFGNLTPPEVIAARTGTLSMSAFAGTTPTSNIGSFSGVTSPSLIYPSLSLNFNTRSVQVGSFSWAFTAGTFSFPAGAGTIFVVPGRGAGVNASIAGTFSAATISAAPAVGAMSGAFFGPAGNHLGLGIGVTSTGVAGAPVSGQGVTIYKPVPGA